MSDKSQMHTCPSCGFEIYPKKITVEYVESDGCRRRGPGGNIRTRDHVGYDDRQGSFRDEMVCRIRTPWSSLEAKENALAVLTGDECEFAASLPYVREID